MDSVTAILLVQYIVILASSGFNAVYFWGYRSAVAGRRVGAAVMAFVSVATFLESLMLYLSGRQWAPLHVAPWLGARLLVGMASLSVTVLILRKTLSGRS